MGFREQKKYFVFRNVLTYHKFCYSANEPLDAVIVANVMQEKNFRSE
jgi:hypothetical protein